MDIKPAEKMEMQLLPWIKDDIAIEIIGKMIAEQTEQLYIIAAEYKQKGFPFDSQRSKQTFAIRKLWRK